MGRWGVGGGLFAVVAFATQIAAAQLLTIEEAQKISKTTGRPILAMAGSKT
jgi:hypothetical protein